MDFIAKHWLEIVGILWSVDQILKIVSPLTKNKFDDNLADILGKLLASFGGKKPV